MDFNSRNDYSKYASGYVSTDYESLPMQMLPRRKKDEKWGKLVMDTLENIGLKQIRQNRAFADYRLMQQGRLVYSDFDETQTDLRGIAATRQQQQLPTFLKHYDLIGRIINLLVGEFNKQKDTINIVSTDIFSVGDFLREKNTEIRKFTEDYFNKVIEIGMLEKGIDSSKTDFKSEEEKQAYLQQLQVERDKIVPPDQIEKDLEKNFKTSIVEWAEKTIESNYLRFSLDMLDTEELKDYLSTGRYFRNYYVGYDSYEPETWDVERTFISEDLDVLYPQDCEYVGTIHLMSGAKVLSRWGHQIPKNIQNKLYGEEFYSSKADSVGPLTYLEKGTGTPTSVPHAAYYQQQTAQAFQNLVGTPWGLDYYKGDKGEIESRYNWVTAPNTGNRLSWARQFREDINPRTDDIQVTEAYFRSQKLVGLLTIENPLTQEPYQTMVEEDLIPEFLKFYNIKKQSTKSWEEVVRSPMDNINTITYGFLPEIWKGCKINANGTNLKEDYYFGIEPLEYQITGTRNDFDVKIPVGGIISSGIGQMIRSYQTDYNIVMNQNRQYLEKTIGAFFLIDWNLLPSQFKGENGDTSAEMAEEWREGIREAGFGFVDQSPRNTKGQNPNQNNIQQYDISFINNIQMNLQMARDLEDRAFAIIGITRERQGNPNEYMTNEGIKQGVEASYAQTEIIYKRFNTAKIKEKEIELSIAQHCAVNMKEISVNYINGQNERIIQNFIDEDFAFRKLEIYPADDSSKRKELEMFKNIILQRNTMDSSLYDLAKVVTADNFVALLDYGLQQEKKKMEDIQQTRQHEKEITQQTLDAQTADKEQEWSRQEKRDQLDRDSNEYIAEVKARAVLADSNIDTSVLDEFFRKQDQEQKERESQIKNDQKQSEIGIKQESQNIQRQTNNDKMKLEAMKLEEKAKDRQARLVASKDKVAVARINPG